MIGTRPNGTMNLWSDPMSHAARISADKDEQMIEYEREKRALKARVAELETALRQIAARGGNRPDDHLTTRSGPNDAEARGLMYVDCRDIARAALKGNSHE